MQQYGLGYIAGLTAFVRQGCHFPMDASGSRNKKRPRVVFANTYIPP